MRLPIGAALAAFPLAAAGCSPGSAPQANVQEAGAEASAGATAPPAEQVPGSAGKPAPVKTASPAAPPTSGVRRCGWLWNPTPANWWLTDSKGQWILATQGGDQTPGMDEMPDMTTAGWVETNGHYGYGCACMTIAYDAATERVTRIADAQPKPLKQCRADRSLPRPE